MVFLALMVLDFIIKSINYMTVKKANQLVSTING